MDDLTQLDENVYGTFGGPREYTEAAGRFGGGGWIATPMAASDEDGKGHWAERPAAGNDATLVKPGFVGNGPFGESPIMDAVKRASGPFGRVGGSK